jgi:hypothetical protein
MPDTDPIWMVVTLKSGAQLRALVEQYVVKRCPITGLFTRIEWTHHESSPTKLAALSIDEVAAVHTEYVTKAATNAE